MGECPSCAGRKELAEGKAAAAKASFEAAGAIPENLPTEHEVGRAAELAYWTAMACKAETNLPGARERWAHAATGESSEGRRRGKSGLSEQRAQIYFQALSQPELGQAAEAETALRDLLVRPMTR